MFKKGDCEESHIFLVKLCFGVWELCTKRKPWSLKIFYLETIAIGKALELGTLLWAVLSHLPPQRGFLCPAADKLVHFSL